MPPPHTYVPPTLPEIIDATVLGHFGHHEVIHKFVNDNSDIAARFAALEAFMAGLTRSEYVLGPFTMPGDITGPVLSEVDVAVPINGTIIKVKANIGVSGTPLSMDLDATKNGTSIFTAGTHPGPHFTNSQSAAEAAPDPAKAQVVENDKVRIHIVGFTGSTVKNLVVEVLILPS